VPPELAPRAAALPWRTYRASISYVHDGDASTGDPYERGREWVTVSVSPDGSRTLTARCEIDDSAVERHVIYAVDERWQPVDASIRLSVGGRFVGSGWFRFDDATAECETFMTNGGRVSQRVSRASGSGAEATSFGAHPVSCDVWHLGGYRPSGTSAAVLRHTAFMSSLLPNGASGPMLSTMTYGVEELGIEDVTVPAGTFACHHYRYVFDDGHPDEHVWYTGDDLVLVKLRWDLLRTTYVLTELTGEPRVGRRTL
jgi:hypothetical protein